MAHPIIDRPHTVSSYDTELGKVGSIITEMADLANTSLAGAMAALQHGDAVAALAIVEQDAAIDELERALERLTLMMIMSRAPMAGDLRYLISAIRIGKMLERTGDQAKRIARRIDTLGSLGTAPAFALVSSMQRYACEMISDAVTSFHDASLERAQAVIRADKELNAMNRMLVQSCCDAMDNRAVAAREGIEVIALGKQLERVGDYAANIAGDVAYMLTGE